MDDKIKIGKELALLVLLSALWGASYTFIRVGVETIPPITFIAVRTLIAGLLLFAMLRLRGVSLSRDARLWRQFAVQAALNSVFPFTLIAWAEQTAEAGLAVILSSMTPVFTFLLTALIIRHEAVTLRKLFGVAAGLFGTSLIIGMEAFSGIGDQVWAQLAIVAATLSYACAAIFGKRFKGLDAMVPAAGSLLCGAVILVPVSLVVDRPWTIMPSAASLAALLALSVFSTALAFAIYFRLVQTLGSVGATSQAYLRVPIGVVIGAVFLGETLTANVWLGLVSIIVGIVSMALPARRSAPAV